MIPSRTAPEDINARAGRCCCGRAAMTSLYWGRGLGYTACLIGTFLLLLVVAKVPKATVDMYSTSLRVILWQEEEEGGKNATGWQAGRERGLHRVIYLPKPVDVDVAHGINIAPLFIFSGFLVGAFAFMTARMEAVMPASFPPSSYQCLFTAERACCCCGVWREGTATSVCSQLSAPVVAVV